MLIARFSTLMLQGQRPTIYGNGLQTRDFTHVTNVIHANVLALETQDKLSGHVVNIGTGVSISLLHLVNELNRLLGSHLEPIHEAPRAGDVMHSLAALTQAQGVLNYRPIVSFEEGLAQTLDWARYMTVAA